MTYILGQDAKATGKSKATIQRYLENGRISGQKTDGAEWRIEARELHRVLPPVGQATGTGGTPNSADGHPVLQAENEGLRRQVALLESQLHGARRDQDHWRNHVTALVGARQLANGRWQLFRWLGARTS